MPKVKNPVFHPVFPDQLDPEIRKFLQIPNGLAKTVNLIYYLQKVIFGAPDGPGPPDGAGAGAGGHLSGRTSIRSSSVGQDEAIDTPTVVLGALVWPVRTYLPFNIDD